MKLKDSTFAIIAEKKDSISHKWFKANLAKSQEMSYCNSGELYEYNKTLYICGYKSIEKAEEDGYCEPIYTESEFEALLKAEEDSMKDELFLSIEANEKILKEAATLNKSQISGVIDWINTWEQLKDTAIPLRFEEDFMSKLKAEQENERFDQVLQKGIDNSRLNEPLTETLNELEQKLDLAISKETPESLKEWLKTDHNPPEPQVTFTYQTAIDLLAYYTKIDKGIIKIEMP